MPAICHLALILLLLVTASALNAAEMRVWKSANGHTTTAKLIAYKHPNVTLEMEDGTQIKVQIYVFSERDQDYISLQSEEEEPTPKVEKTYERPIEMGRSRWYDNYADAHKEATERGLPMLILYTNSHSCPPCIRLKKDVLTKYNFSEFSKEEVIPMVIDFAPIYMGINKRVSGEVLFEHEQKTGAPDKLSLRKRGWPHVIIIRPDEFVLFSDGVGNYQEDDFLQTLREAIEFNKPINFGEDD